MRIELLGAAEAELIEAIQWYDAHQPDLGDEFLAEVNHASHRIEAFPRAWPKISRRSAMSSKSPYGMVYQIRKDMILIIAVMHLHRQPLYWRERE